MNKNNQCTGYDFLEYLLNRNLVSTLNRFEKAMKEESIKVIMQAFYGNRTYVEIATVNIDFILQGVMDYNIRLLSYGFDRTVVKLPGSECVLIYNRYQEEAALKDKEELIAKKEYVWKPLAVIPEEGVEIYSRCFVCRMDDQGNLTSIHPEDCEIVAKYLSE